MGRTRNPVNRLLMMRKKGLASPYMNNLGNGQFIKSGFSGSPIATAGATEGADCLGTYPTVVFSSVISTVGTVANGVTIETAGGAKTYTPTSATGTGTNTISYVGTWDSPLVYGDVITYTYDSATGEHEGSGGSEVQSSSVVLTNCEPPATANLISPQGGTLTGFGGTNFIERTKSVYYAGTRANTNRLA